MKLLFKLTAIEVIRTRDYLWRAICAAPDERGELYHLAEALMDLAYELGRWRSVHLLTVERLLGLSRALAVPQGSAGRGGSPGTISSPSCGRPGRRCEEIPKAGQAND
ncbi:MAG TPA: hypothetical protein VFQ44_16320 [Streptosporangiaceae bacterium]|nr:hypothetical protein [Streptosporangiaceae bacterium]